MGLIADIHKDLENGALQLIVEYSERLRVLATQMCGDETQAEDLVFRTFERVLTKAKTYKSDTNLLGWMKSIMENIHKDDLKRPVARNTTAVEAEELEQIAGADWSTDEQVIRNSDSEALRAALRDLPPEYRQTVILRFYEDLSLKEIASFLNKPVGTVGRRIHVALHLLSGKLSAEMGKAKKPLAVLLATLLGVGALFGAWQAGLLEPLLSQITDTARSGEAESFPRQEETTSTQLQPQSETDLTQDESQSETTKGQTMNLKTVKTLAASAVVAASAAVASAASTAEYVQEGLIACWDGYANDGVGGHATTLDRWTDTSGRYSFVFNENSGITVDGNALFFPGTDVGYAKLSADDTDATFEKTKDGTCEIVIVSGPTAGYNVALQSSAQSGIALGAWERASASVAAQLVTSSNGNRPSALYNWSSEISTLATTYTATLSQGTWANGTNLSSSAQHQWSLPSDETFLGHRAVLSTGQSFKGWIYAIRLYSTKLTPEQIAANHAVDVKRFVKGDVYPMGSVFVSGEPQNYAAGLASPVYGLVDKTVGEDVRLTAPEYVDVSAAERVSCKGWKLYARETNELVAESTSRTRLTCAFTYKTPVRVVWEWETLYRVKVTAADGLTVTPASAWGNVNTPVSFAVAGADFPVWSGEGLVGDFRAKRVAYAPAAPTEAIVREATVREPTNVAGLMAEISAAEDCDVVIVPDGTNSFADVTLSDMVTGLAINKNVLVTSRSGNPKDVTIDLGGTGYGFTLNAEDARLRGITFTSSAQMTDSSDSTLPRIVRVVAGRLEDCIIRDITIGGTTTKGSYPVLLGAGGIVTGCLFTNILNRVVTPAQGGTIVANGGIVSNTQFVACNTYLAPIVTTSRSTLFVEDCLFTGLANATYTSAHANWGAIYVHKGDVSGSHDKVLVVRRTTVANNTATSSGVAHYWSDSSANYPMIFEDCVFSNNVGTAKNGVLEGGGYGCYTCNRCRFENNLGSEQGVLNAINDVTQTFRNCLFFGNTGKKFGGIVYTSATNPRFKFENCTATENKTVEGAVSGIGIANCGTTANTWIRNCIVWGNTGGETQLAADANKVSCSCYPEAVANNERGNISDDPKFRKSRRYRGYPSSNGPCFEAGDPSIWAVDDLDLAGNPRLRKGKVDIGCYQTILSGLILMLK